MTISKLKKYIFMLGFVFLLLVFITWQHITIFNLGYGITKLKRQVRSAQVRRQQIMVRYRKQCSMDALESYAAEQGMVLPDGKNVQVMEVEDKDFTGKDHIKILVSQLKKMFSPSEAQAR